MGVDRDRVDSLFGLLRTYVGRLQELAETPAEVLAEDPLASAALERYLQLAIQTLLDVGHHVVSALGLPQPVGYADIFTSLAKGGVIDPTFAQEIAGMAGLRNRLVHAYGDIQPARLHDFASTRLDDFGRFAAEVTAYLDAAER